MDKKRTVVRAKKNFRIYRQLGGFNAGVCVCAGWLIYPLDMILWAMCIVWGLVLLVSASRMHHRYTVKENAAKDGEKPDFTARDMACLIAATLIAHIVQMRLSILKPVFGWLVHLVIYQILFREPLRNEKALAK